MDEETTPDNGEDIHLTPAHDVDSFGGSVGETMILFVDGDMAERTYKTMPHGHDTVRSHDADERDA